MIEIAESDEGNAGAISSEIQNDIGLGLRIGEIDHFARAIRGDVGRIIAWLNVHRLEDILERIADRDRNAMDGSLSLDEFGLFSARRGIRGFPSITINAWDDIDDFAV